MCLGYSLVWWCASKAWACDGLDYAVVEFGGLRRRVCVSCVPDAVPGDYVIIHAGVAISRLDAPQADRLLQELRTLGDMDGWADVGSGTAEEMR